MPKLTMRERIRAVVQLGELDQVPFVQFDNMVAPNEEVWAEIGREELRLLRWTRLHRIEYPNCQVHTETFERDGLQGTRDTIHTPRGSLRAERLHEPAFNTASTKEHCVKEPEDYEVLCAYLEDGVVVEDLEPLEQAY